MLIKKELYSPLIRTIPDDTALFSILNFETKIAKKIIMENYINFYCFKDFPFDYTVLRFENFMDYESIEGLERCFIPIDIVKKYYYNLDIFFELLNEGYIILMPIHRSSIAFYGEQAEGNHLLLIYGFDTLMQVFLCKDFEGYNFVEFNVTFNDMKKSILSYFRPYSRESNGLLALRICNSTPPFVNYSKVYTEFNKLGQEFMTHKSGYGLGAVNLFLKDIQSKPLNSVTIYSWYVLANYLRESTKLINIRYNILEEEICKKQIKKLSENRYKIKKLSHDVDNLYFKVCKLFSPTSILSDGVSTNLSTLVYVCKEDLKEISYFLCEIISNFLND